MSDMTPFEAHIGGLISAYADRAPVVVDPAAMARLSAASATQRSVSFNRPPREWANLLVVVVLLAALAAGTVAVAGQVLLREYDDRLSDRVLVAPFEGLPPPAAPPSSPEHGELVLSFVARVKGIGDDVHAMWLYEDGRLIWRRNLDRLTENGARAFGSMEPTTAILEQRLNAEGIQLLLSEGLTSDALIGDQWGHGPEVVWGALRVRIDGQLTGVNWESWDLPRRLADPLRWLPARAWADERISAYVASRYAIAISPGDFERLPDRVQAVLDANGARMRTGGPGAAESFVVGTEAARQIVDVLERDGRRLESLPNSRELPSNRRQLPIERALPVAGLWYAFGEEKVGSPEMVTEIPVVSLEPILPHGETPCLTCG